MPATWWASTVSLGTFDSLMTVAGALTERDCCPAIDSLSPSPESDIEIGASVKLALETLAHVVGASSRSGSR